MSKHQSGDTGFLARGVRVGDLVVLVLIGLVGLDCFPLFPNVALGEVDLVFAG